MDPAKIVSFELVQTSEFLRNHDFGKTLKNTKGGEAREFRGHCREFVAQLVDGILSSRAASSVLVQEQYSFCPELSLEGDDQNVFSVFNKLLRVLEWSGVVTSTESNVAVEEFLTFVVDIRAPHGSSGRSASDIGDLVAYLLADFGFLARQNLYRVVLPGCSKTLY